MRQDKDSNLRPDLSDAVSEYMAQAIMNDFMGSDILPVYEAGRKSGNYPVIKVEQAEKDVGDLQRASGAESQKTSHKFGSDSYEAVEYSLKEFNDDADVAENENYFDVELETTQLVSLEVLREYEQRVDSAVFATGNNSIPANDVSTVWTSGTPYDDIQDAKLTLNTNLGGSFMGAELCLAMSKSLFVTITQNSNIESRLGGGSSTTRDARPETIDRIRSVLGVDQLFVSNAQRGGSDIWSNSTALLFLRARPGASLRTLSLGRTFLWSQYISGNGMAGAEVDTWREDDPPGEYVRVRHATDEKIVVPEAGYLLTSLT